MLSVPSLRRESKNGAAMENGAMRILLGNFLVENFIARYGYAYDKYKLLFFPSSPLAILFIQKFLFEIYFHSNAT